jgi:2-C-methyl-D-erythritol 4-phosphate cytidylyltransferase
MTIAEQKTPVWAVVVAGGSGQRFGGPTPKQYLDLAGAPILAWSLAAFERADGVDHIIAVVPEDDVLMVGEGIVDAYSLRKVRRVVPGGCSRQDSTARGLDAVEDRDGIVLVHDGVRPFISDAVIAQAIASADESGSGLVATPVTDTIKRVEDSCVAETIPREALWAAQTPQAFTISLLRRAMEQAIRDGFEGTDEAQLVERIGHRVRIVPGDSMNIKITNREDLERAELIASRLRVPGDERETLC